MAAVNKIDSNITGLAYAEETSLKTLPGTPVWVPLEPNSYNDFGGQITTVARNPINPSRQRKKGVVTDLDASGGFNTDLTQTNIQELLQGFFFADLRNKGQARNTTGTSTLLFAAATSGSRLTRSGTPALDLTTQFAVGDLVFIKGFANSANNGLFAVGAVAAATIDLDLPDGSGTAATLVTESAVGTVSIVDVGRQTISGDVDVDMAGSRPALTSTTLNFTTLGLTVGEWIFIGGDDSVETAYSTAANNGFARVRSIAATRLEFDKTQFTMATEANTDRLVHLYFGRVLKNEVGVLIKRRSYNIERQLGAPDDSNPSQIQSEYLAGAIPNEFNLNITQASKVEADLSFVALDNEQRLAATGIKSGTRLTLPEADAFNTSSDFTRIKLASVNETNANPIPLFAFATDISITVTNNVTPNKAIGVFGAFDATAGTFAVGGSITAYFANIAAVQAVRNNADVTLDAHLVKNNSGISIDIPMLSLGDGRAAVEQDQPITLPLTSEAATGAKIDPNLNHTLLMMFWDYLPTLADS